MSQMSEGNGMTPTEEVAYGCLFCRSGSEERIIQGLKNSYPNMECLSPKRVRIRRQGEKELATLFPGYIFFRNSDPVIIPTLKQTAEIYRVLQYPNGEWKLHGSDLSVAMMMFEWGGTIELSKACFKEDGVKIISGPLKAYENSITRVNKRTKTAQVMINFNGEALVMWLGFEIDAQ